MFFIANSEAQLNQLIKNVAVWLVIALVLMTVFNQYSKNQSAQSIIPYSQFMDEVKNGRVKSALVEGRTVRWQSIDERKYVTYSPGTLGDLWMVSDLLKAGVKVDAKPEEEQSFLSAFFFSWGPMLLLIGVWIFFMRQMQGGGRGGAFSFGKSRAKLLTENQHRVTFSDVAGVDEAKDDLQEIIGLAGSQHCINQIMACPLIALIDFQTIMEEGEQIKRARIHAVFCQIEMCAAAHCVDQHQMAR